MTLYGCFSTILFYSWFKFFSNHAVKIFLTWFEHFVSNGVISKGSFFGWCLVGKLDFNLVKYSKKLQPILRKVCWQTLIVSLLNFFFLFFLGGGVYFILFSLVEKTLLLKSICIISIVPKKWQRSLCIIDSSFRYQYQ